jgi:hypothetical protein
MVSKTEQLLDQYLRCIGIEGYAIHAADDSMGFLLTVDIPRDNNEKIGILKGKDGQNLVLLKKMMRIVGVLERKTPFLIIRLMP